MGDFQVGSTVRIKQGARDMNYGCLFASFVYNRDYTVLEIRGDRVVFGWSNGAITGVTQRSNIIYNGSSGGQPEVSNKSVAPSNPDDYSWGSVKNDFADAAVGESERFTCSTNEDISSGHKLANYFTAYARTYYHFTRDTVIINRFTSDDGATLYLNNVALGHNDAHTGNDQNSGCEVHMHFQKGWNLVEVVVHEVTPPCWWNFKVDPKTNKYCDGQSSLSDYLDAHSIKWYFNKFTDGTGFKIGTNELTDEKYKLAFDQEETVTARLLSAVKAFDGEMSYSFTIKGLAITGLYVNFFKKRGKETDIELRYGREISNITSRTSIENLATALKATGSNIDAYNHALTLYGYQYDDGDIYVDQTDGILKSRTALAYYHRYQFGTGEGHITKTFNYDTTNQATLFAKAYEELKKVSVPEINYEVTIQIPPKNVHIGDTIRIIDEKGGLYLRARVIKLVRSFYQNELTITLGDYLIESSQISKQIKDLAQQFALMQQTMPRYTWYAYADDPVGTNISMYPYDSETDDLTGVTTYTHFRKYVGIAYNMSSASVSLSDPNIFQWSLIKGEDGIPGSNGADGKTYYFHVAYANKDGNGSIVDFSTTNSDGRAYIGTYSDEYQPDATVPGAYKWQLVKGKDGESSIAHMAYANKDDNGNITDFSTSTNQNRKWIGVAVDYNDTAPTDPTKYTWAKYIGDDGYTPEVSVSKHDGVASITVKGKDGTSTTTTVSDGKDGTSIKGDDAYLHIAYATSADGKENFKTGWFSGATYLGIYSDHTKLDSSTYTDYKWSLIKGKDGTNGIKGADGHSPTVTATKTGSTTTISVDGVEQATIKDGEKGKDGKGIKSTSITYQASSSQTTVPSGTWVTSVPTLSASNPYLWTRTVITYTDNMTSTSYSVGSTLEGVNVGGRNLYLDTKGFNHPSTWDNFNKWTKTGETYNGFTVISNTKAWNGATQKIQAKEGETYTFSAYVKNTDGVYAAIYIPDNSTVSATVSPTSLAIPQSTDFARYALTFRVTKSGEIRPRVECGVNVANKIKVCGLKLERGNVATDWTPAPEDVDARIDSTIIKHEQEYYLSTSDTSLAGGSWSTTFPTRKDGTFYWVRYKDTHANNAVTYDPSANGKLLTEVNEVWHTVVSNQTAINSSNAQINMVATSVTSVKNDLNKKADTESVNSSMDKLSGTVTDIGKQIADLKVKASSIEASVTEVNNLAQTTKKATAALTANGLSVDTGQTTKSVVDGTGLTITSKADNSVVAKFTTGESEIQNLKIDGFMKIGAHVVQKMQDTEWDGTTVNGTGWMWNGG